MDFTNSSQLVALVAFILTLVFSRLGHSQGVEEIGALASAIVAFISSIVAILSRRANSGVDYMRFTK